MNKLILGVLLSLSVTVNAEEFNVDEFLSKTYVRVGAGYKFNESEITHHNDDGTIHSGSPISARIGVYYQYSDNVRIGIDHHSQWLTGFPVNDDTEYYKTELFIDYTFSLR